MKPGSEFSVPRIGAMLLLCVVAAAVYLNPLRDIVSLAVGDPDQGYLFFVPVFAVYLAWLRRTRLYELSLGPSIWGLLIILVGWFGFGLGAAYDIRFLWHAGFVFGVIGILVAFLGTSILVPFAPAFFALFAIVPIPGELRRVISIPLQGSATSITNYLLDLMGVHSIRRGYALEINEVTVFVGEACNGMRLLVPLVLVIFIFVFSLPLRSSVRCLLVVSSIPVALLCNTVRLVPTSIAYAYAPGVAEITHDVGGWLMIPIAIATLLGLVRLLEWLDVSVSRWRLVTAS